MNDNGGNKMDKELAKKILGLTLDSQRIEEEKWELQQRLNLLGWDKVCTKAMEFLMDNPS